MVLVVRTLAVPEENFGVVDDPGFDIELFIVKIVNPREHDGDLVAILGLAEGKRCDSACKRRQVDHERHLRVHFLIIGEVSESFGPLPVIFKISIRNSSRLLQGRIEHILVCHNQIVFENVQGVEVRRSLFNA